MTVWSRLFAQGDALHTAVVLALLIMSVSSWVVILWKAWLLRRSLPVVHEAVRLFWAAPDWAHGARQVELLDSVGLVAPLVQAATQSRGDAVGAAVAAQAGIAPRLTRLLRDALLGATRRLHAGQIVLASVGATSPFVGLLGTVWGIYHALVGMAAEGQVTIEKVSGPVGEALVMTAAGLGVAIPAVLAYNAYGRLVSGVETELDAFAHDLREWVLAVDAQTPGRT